MTVTESMCLGQMQQNSSGKFLVPCSANTAVTDPPTWGAMPVLMQHNMHSVRLCSTIHSNVIKICQKVYLLIL